MRNEDSKKKFEDIVMRLTGSTLERLMEQNKESSKINKKICI